MSPLFPRDAVDDGTPNPNGQSLANVSLVFITISTVLVCIRWYTRIYINRLTGLDDWMILLALLMAIALTYLYCEEAAHGFGFHESQVSAEHNIQALKYFFGAQVLYKSTTCVTKVSLLLLYLRIFTSRTFRVGSWIVMTVVVGYGFATIVATLFQCNPVPKAWNSKLEGKCINVGASWYATAALAIITDAAIIVLPIREIHALNLPRAQKIGLSLLFSLGAFVIVTTVVRIVKIGPATTSQDATYYQAFSNTWTDIEVNTGIICACLPILKAPILILFPRLSLSTRNASQPRRSRGPALSGSGGGGSGKHAAPSSARGLASYGQGIHPNGRRSSGLGKSLGRSATYEAAGSDEEIMLEGVGGGGMAEKQGIVKTTDVSLAFEHADVEPWAGRGEGRGAGEAEAVGGGAGGGNRDWAGVSGDMVDAEGRRARSGSRASLSR